jgi:hypothetical protein
MPRVRFSGRIYPSAFHISIDNLPAVDWRDEELESLGLNGTTCHVTIQQSVVSVECEVQHFSKEHHLMPLYIRSLDIVRASVDLMSVATGAGLQIVMDELTEPSGATSKLAPEQPNLAQLVPSIATMQGYDAVLRLVIPKIAALRVVHDMAEAISQTHIAPINRGRVIDGLRQAIAPTGSLSHQWQVMRDNLRVDKAYLQIVTDLSRGPRHGNTTHIPGPVVKDAVDRTWAVANRYFEYLKRGEQPLPESEFPMLTG